jgi:ferredoxin-type protein NapH
MGTPAKAPGRLALPPLIALTAFVAANLLFFHIFSASGWKETAAGILFAAFSCLCFFMINYSGKPSAWRRILFASFALLMVPSFVSILIETRGSMSVDARDVFLNETPFCHMVIPMAIIPYLLRGSVIFPARVTGHFASMYSMLLIWLSASLLLGRGWCSWVCFYGGWDDAMSRASKKARVKLDPLSARLRLFPFAMLALVVLGSLASLAPLYCDWLCPFKAVTEFGQITGIVSFIATIVFILTFFGFTILMPILTRKRFQCAVFCPFGAFQSLVGRISPYRVKIDEKACVSCGKCAAVCPTLSIDPASLPSSKKAMRSTCTSCGECVQACPEGAISYRFSWEENLCPDGSLLARTASKLSASDGKASRAMASLLRGLDGILSAQALMTTCAVIFGSVVSGGFAIDTIVRVLSLVTTGRFLNP